MERERENAHSINKLNSDDGVGKRKQCLQLHLFPKKQIVMGLFFSWKTARMTFLLTVAAEESECYNFMECFFNTDLFVCLFGFYSITTFVGYLMPNPFLYKWTVLFQIIQFSISTQFNCQKHFYFTQFSFIKQFYFKQFNLVWL